MKIYVDLGLDYLDPGYLTNGNLTISSNSDYSDAISDFSTSHR